MIDFQEELSKFRPALELDHIEETIHSNEIRDMIDLLTYIAKNIESKLSSKE